MKHAVFDHGPDNDGCYWGTNKAVEFYRVTGQWADEISGCEPRPDREDFYLLVALKLGSPDGERWIERNAKTFYAMWREWTGTDDEGPEALIQYMLWYERDRPKD